MLDEDELRALGLLDAAVRAESTTARIDEVISRVEQALQQRPDDLLAWEPIPLELFGCSLPEMIRSSWVFILRANAITGPERHPNSHQRMMSYRGMGDLQTRTHGPWKSHFLKSDRLAPIEQRWLSIPPNVWHQGVVPAENWVVVSFHTVPEGELIEERPNSGRGEGIRQRKYEIKGHVPISADAMSNN